MKKILLLIWVCSFLNSFSQSFPVEDIYVTGPDSNRIVFVFLGDGYLASQQDKYISDVNNMVDELFNKSPFLEYKNFFNVYAVKVPSNVEGASTNPSNLIDNYFGSAFGVGGITRLLVPQKSSKVYQVLNASFPNYDQILMMVNSSTYGGSGGTIATMSTNSQSGEIGIHEIGHSFANLADEYYFRVQERPNQTSESDPTKVKWASWVNLNSVGVYPHAENTTQYRPHQNCEMRYLNRKFCWVCREAFVDRFYTLISSIDQYTPASTHVNVSQESVFSIEVVEPDPNTLKINWTLNGEELASDVKSVDLGNQSLDFNNTLIVNVLDTTSFTHKTNHVTQNTKTVVWSIANDVTGTSISTIETYSSRLSVYPNPAREKIQIQLDTDFKGAATWELWTTAGRRIDEGLLNANSNDSAEVIFSDYEELPLGVYFVKVNLGTNVLTRKVVVE